MSFVATIQECPHCGSDEGYYTKEQVHGTIKVRYNFNGSEAENGDMYDSIKYTGGKVAYCLECNKQLFKMDSLK